MPRSVPRVLNMWGERVGKKITTAVPDAGLVEVGSDVTDDLYGEALFAAWPGHPIFEHLDDVGVEWMHLPGTGIDGWPLQLLEGRTVTCSRGVSAIPIAEFVLAAMLAFEKRIPDVWLHEPPEQWNIDRLGELAGKTLGLVGLGGIGTAIARRAVAFEMRVLASRRTGAPSSLDGVEVVSLAQVLGASDHLVLALPATHRTHHLLDADALAVVKPGVHLVNIARGSLVDQDALRAALDDDRIALASLDTVEPEPLPPGHWLYAHPKVRVSAHVSWSSPKAFDRIIDSFVGNLRRYVAGEPLQGVVDLNEGY